MKAKTKNGLHKNGSSLKQAIAELALKQTYSQINSLRTELSEAGFAAQKESLKKYLYLLVKEEKLNSAGRGWYSNLIKPFMLDTQPVDEFINRLRKQFRLLEFSCWSGVQVQSWFHHLPGKLPLFVFVEKDAQNPLFEYLRDHYSNCYLNPQKRDIQQTFRLTEDTVIIRPAISEEPKSGYHATIEKILVDLLIEKQRLELFDEWEY